MLNNKEFYKYAKEYALAKLTAEYQKEQGLSPAEARSQAEKRMALLIKPVESCNVNSSKATIQAIYCRLLASCQNRSMMPNVIKFDANRKIFEKLLDNFDPKKVLAKYKSANDLYMDFEKTFNVNKSHNQLWQIFAQSVIDGAKFISNYKNVSDFKHTIDNIAAHFTGTLMIPRLISGEIRGLGEVLACDFIKEIGYVEYAKPDVHIEYIIKKICNNEK